MGMSPAIDPRWAGLQQLNGSGSDGPDPVGE